MEHGRVVFAALEHYRMMKRILFLLPALCLFLSACARPAVLGPGARLDLASFEEKGAAVQIALEFDNAGQAWLVAVYSPLREGGHFYSMDTPREGVNGMGRPTLLEIVPGSQLRAVGPLTADLTPQPAEGGAGLFVYPPGPLTLRLPVALPPGTAWVDERLAITCMVCNDVSCSPPVEQKIVVVRVPGAGLVANPSQ
jgi:hypothetical protein